MASSNEIGFIHTVFFWLKEGVTEEQKKDFEKGMEALGQSPNIVKYYYGQPEGSDREVVDDSFDYSWIVHFKNSEDQARYQNDDPIHDVFVENFKDLWAKVKVYDSILA